MGAAEKIEEQVGTPIVVKVSELRRFPLNPRALDRKSAKYLELVESVRAQGITTPPIIRRGKGAAKGVYETIAGERRGAAAHDVGIEELLCVLREDLDDDARAFDVCVLENLQRDDLTPLEEAEAFAARMKRDGLTAAELASKLNVDVTRVRQYLKLLDLVTPIRKLADAGKLDLGAAVVIAQLPEASQKTLVKNLEAIAKEQSSVTKKDVAGLLEHGYARLLSSAQWEVGDAELIPKAGPCSTCPKRTGKQGSLFEVTGVEDACLDGVCWDEKQGAWWKRKTEDAQKKGLKVLSLDEAEKVIRYGRVDSNKYIDSKVEVKVGEKPTKWGYNDPVYKKASAIVGDATPKTLAFDQKSGRVFELLDRKVVDEAAAIAQKANTKAAKSRSGKADTSRQSEAARMRLKVEIDKRAKSLYLAAIVAGIESGKIDKTKALRVTVAIVTGDTEAKDVVKRRGLARAKGSRGGENVEAVMKHAADIVDGKGAETKMLAFLVELAVAGRMHTHMYGSGGAPKECTSFGLDYATHRKLADQQVRAEKKAKKTKGAKPAAEDDGDGDDE